MEAKKQVLETSLEELDAQHTQAIQEIVRKRDELLKANEQLKQEVKDLQSKLNQSFIEGENDKRDASKDSSEILTKMQSELQRAEQQAQQLKREKEEKTKYLEEMKQKLSHGALALNELHMDKKELENRLQKLQNELKESEGKVGALSKEKRDLEELHRKMEEECNSTKEELHVLKDSTAHNHLQQELLQLKENLDESQKLSTQYELKLSHFEEELELLQEKLETSDAEKLQLHSALDNSVAAEGRMREQYEEQVKQLSTERKGLEAQKVALKEELYAAESKLSDQAKQYEACIEKLRTARELDTSSLGAEHEKLIRSNEDKEAKIAQLENDCGRLQAQVSDTKDLLQDTINGQNSLTEMISEKDSELHDLKSENTALKKTLEETIAKSKGFQTDLDRLVEVEKLYKCSADNCEKLKHEVETLNSKLQTKEDGAKREEDNMIGELESQVTNLQSIIQEQNSELQTYQKQIGSLELEGQGHIDHAVIKQYEDTIQEQQSSINFLQLDVSAKNVELQQATEKINRLASEVGEYKSKLHEATISKELSDETNSNTDNGNGFHATDTQVEELREIISQKDDIVNELKSNNDALLRLLEERSMQLHGDKTLVEMHKLENEVRGLRMEREQIMNVLNEKSRECSSLKGEVHKLMNVISAEKAALSKLQQDNHELIMNKQGETRATESKEGNKEMTKEAVKKLSQIIRDKDLEIESLTQKNETLLQVLQETGGASSDVASAQLGTLIQDKDNLMKQVALFQKDREQIITALNQKHQEVALYYTELQKLTAVNKDVTEKQDELNRQFTMLQHQYEDKQQQLLRSQKELFSFKQKYTEADNRYHELLQRCSESPREIVNGSVVKENGSTTEIGRESPFCVIKEDIEDIQVQNEQHLQKKGSQSPANNNVASPAFIEEKLKEIDSLKTQVQKLRENVKHKDCLLEEMKKRVENRDGLVQQRDNVIGGKDKTISELNARVHRAEEKLSQKDMEINAIRKQQENLTFQLQGLRSELQDTSTERDQLTGQIAGLQSEVALLKETKSKFSNGTVAERA